MDYGKYYSLKSELSELVVQASTSYDGSLAKELDIYTVSDGLNALITSYEELKENVNSQVSYSAELEYSNIKEFGSITLSNIEPYIEKVRDLQQLIASASNQAYSKLRVEYTRNKSLADSNLSKALTAMNSYKSLEARLSRMNSEDEGYSGVKSAKEAALISYNLALDSLSGQIETIAQVLEDGYKRA